MSELNADEIIRYNRQFPIIGLEGQKKLKNAKVLCVGAGGLGCPALQYLSATGIGTLAIMDGDQVELSNLQRQILFTEQDIGCKKATVIAKRLQAMNHHLVIHVYTDFFSKENQQIIQNYDVILDATDNYQTRYLLNTVCRRLKKPLVSASIYQYGAQISVFNYLEGPCYQCLYPTPPSEQHSPNCNVAGVLGVLPGVAGTLQATEVIKVILSADGILSGKLLCFNLLSMQFSQFIIQKQNCSDHPLVEFERETRKDQRMQYSITPLELHQLLESQTSSIQLIDVRQPYEREIYHIGGELIPLADIEASINTLDKQKPVIIYCKSGVRSLHALRIFVEAGFKNVQHLDGGILNWQATIDH